MSQQHLTESLKIAKQKTSHREQASDPAQSSHTGSSSSILQLQRTLGNRHVAQLIQARCLTPQCKTLGLQPKLTVGAADDQYEQEADRVAHQVVSIPNAAIANPMQRVVSPEENKDHTLQTKPLAASIKPFVQRKMGSENEEDKNKLIQPKSAELPAGSFEAGADVESQLSQSKGGGIPLPDPVRAFMEPRFGADFSHVRVHTGSTAIQMNRDVGAEAFTHGADIYFGAGNNPTNLDLTAHELTHVIQQTGGILLQTKKLLQPIAFDPVPPEQRELFLPDNILNPIKSLIGQITGFSSSATSKSGTAVSSTQSEVMTEPTKVDNEAVPHRSRRKARRPASSPNAALRRTVAAQASSTALILRDDMPGQAGASGRWVAPFNLGVMTDKADASVALVDIQRKLAEWKDVGFENEMNFALGSIDRMLDSMNGADLLTVDEANRLTFVGLLAYQAHQNALKNFQQLLTAELDKYTGIAAQDAVDVIAEKLHQTFIDQESASKISDMTTALKKAKDLTSKVSKYVGYAAKTKYVVKGATKLDDLKKAVDGFKGKFSEVTEIAELAKSLLTLSGKIGEKPGSMQNDIAKISTSFKIIDFAISKSNIPIIGQWWEGYIQPCAELALNKLAELDKMVDEQVRLNEERLDEWWHNATGGMRAPSIVDTGLPGLLLQKYFHGGQSMLDFMWSLFRGNTPESIPPEVEDVFVKFRSQFNAGQEEDNQIETDTKWYKPSTWFGRTSSPNLLQWVLRNKETVWAMLYGKLPHP